jgi:hypothetical protein
VIGSNILKDALSGMLVTRSFVYKRRIKVSPTDLAWKIHEELAGADQAVEIV